MPPLRPQGPFLGPVPDQPPAGNVQIGVLEPTDNNANFEDIITEDLPGVWVDYDISNRYEWNPSIYMNGVTSPNGFQGTSVSFVQLAAPTLLLISDWTASRLGYKPTSPSVTPPDDWVLMAVFPETAPSNVMPDGETPVYRISGTYVFAHKNPSASNPFAQVSFPKLPYVQDKYSRRLNVEEMKTNIIFENTTNILVSFPRRG